MASKKTVSSSGDQDELVYFNFRGRAETIRLLYIVSDRPFKDTRVEYMSQEWADMKKNMPHCQVPILKRGCIVISQSMSIARLIAQETGLAGRDYVEQALADAVIQAIEEFANPGVEIFFHEKDEAKKAVRAEEFLKNVLPQALENLNRQVEKNKSRSGYFVGDRMLWCDIHFFVVADRFVRTDPNILSKYPKLQALYATMSAHPKIANWVKIRPETPI